MRAVMRTQRQALDRPAFAIGQVLPRQAGEEHRDLLPCIIMGHIGDLRAHHRRIGYHVVCNGDR